MVKYFVWKNPVGWFVYLIANDKLYEIGEFDNREDAMVECNNLNKMLDGRLI